MEIKKTMEQLIKEQFNTYKRLKKLQNNFNENPVLSSETIVRRELLTTYYKKFCETHDGIEQILLKHEIDASNEEYFKEDLAFKCELLYLEMKGKLLEDQLKEDKIEEKTPSSDLTKIDVLKFSGSLTDWLEFRKKYCALVHENSDLTNSQKFRYLQSALPNEVFVWIKDLFNPGNESGYDIAWTILEIKFNKTLLIDAYLSELLQQPCENTDQLLNATRKCLQGLQSLNVNTKNWDVLLVHLLVGKLNEEIKSKWMQTHSSHEVPKLEKFLTFLNGKGNVGENHSKTLCICCNEKHNLWDCDKFQLLSIDERLKLVKEKSACNRCLSACHNILQCRKAYVCRICRNRSHHVLLHVKGKAAKQRSKSCLRFT